ncbi:hypothetical protein CF98_28050 [Halopseudomonas bauzanensis]|nr:hypothetical protein CF98_28050 [Halopseudomonas bauzanensis]
MLQPIQNQPRLSQLFDPEPRQLQSESLPPLEQRLPELPFQFAYRGGDGRLGHIEAIGCARGRSRLRRRYEIMKLPQRNHYKIFQYQPIEINSFSFASRLYAEADHFGGPHGPALPRRYPYP